jgi:putative transposase
MPLLKAERSCNWFIQAVAQELDEHNIALWAWCIMPTHTHLLVYPRNSNRIRPDISAFLQSVKQSVSRKSLAWLRVNAPNFIPKLIDRPASARPRAHFWQPGGGYDRNLWSPDAVWDMIDYIHCNPVEEKVSRRSIDWKWSSARDFAHIESGPLSLDLRSLPPDARRKR